MQLAETFDLALRLYRAHGWTILGASAVPALFTLAGFAFLFSYVIPGFAFTSQGSSQIGQVMDASLNFLLGVAVAAPLVLIGVSLTTTFVAPLVSDFLLGNVPNAQAAREAQWRTSPRVVLVSLRESLLAAGGAVFGGALLLISAWLDHFLPSGDAAPGYVFVLGVAALVAGCMVALYVISAHALAAPAAVLEDVGPAQASRRSSELMKGRPYHGSGYDAVWSLYFLLGFLGASLLAGAASIDALLGLTDWAGALNIRPLRPLVEGGLQLIPYFVVVWMLVPIWAVTVTIIYFERRVRLEGYDIEALAADVWRSNREGRFLL